METPQDPGHGTSAQPSEAPDADLYRSHRDIGTRDGHAATPSPSTE